MKKFFTLVYKASLNLILWFLAVGVISQLFDNQANDKYANINAFLNNLFDWRVVLILGAISAVMFFFLTSLSFLPKDVVLGQITDFFINFASAAFLQLIYLNDWHNGKQTAIMIGPVLLCYFVSLVAYFKE